MKLNSRLLCLALLFIYQQGNAQADLAEIENYIEKAQKEWAIPGMSVAIVKDGKVFSNRGYGTLKEGGKERVDEKTLFAIASNTKAFISSAIGVLQGEGKMNLNDKVQLYLPDFQLYDSYASHEATIADLLSHRLGLGTFSGDVIWYKSNFSAGEVINKIKYVPQKYSFRGGYGYSNLMFITAGEVIKEVSGISWDQFVKERFLDPLGMHRTITSTNDLELKGNYAVPHKPVEDSNQAIEWVNWDNMGAAGGIISSSEDMARWLIFQLNNGIWENDTILDPGIQNKLWTPHNNYTVSLNAKKDNPGTNFRAYGLGWGTSDYFGNRLITHGGGYDGMYSQVALVPELELGIVILTNTMKGIATPLRNYIINAFIEKDIRDWSGDALKKLGKKSSVELNIEAQKEARVSNTKPSLELSKYAGSYQTNMHGPIYILLEKDKLRLEFENAPDLSAALEHWHYDTWEIKWDKVHAWFDFGTIQFQYDNEMKVTGFEFDVPNYDIFFEELKVQKTDH
jgi:CubicO group peptidase (beta-lactamase class C family)